jgi:hypothetical protein
LAGNIGCHISVQPRKDFSSWRAWKLDEDDKLYLNGHAPLPNDMAPHSQIGINYAVPEGDQGINNNNTNTRNEDEPLAIKKTINKRKSRRTTAPT